MKAPKRKRPIVGILMTNADPQVLGSLASRVRYVGSPEHKSVSNPLLQSQPRLRADASICPKEINSIRTVTDWLKEAINKGAVSEQSNGEFPRYVWYKQGDQVFEGRLVNKDSGEYKGYPIDEFEWPKGLEERYAK